MFSDRHLSPGVLNTKPLLEVRPITASNSKMIAPAGGRWTPQHATVGHRYQHGGNCCTPSQWADRFCGPDPTGACCCRASSEDHVLFAGSPRLTAYRYWYTRYFHSCRVAQAAMIPAAAPESPTTTTPTSGEAMLPGASRTGTTAGKPSSRSPRRRRASELPEAWSFDVKLSDFEIPEFGGSPHRKRYVPFESSN